MLNGPDQGRLRLVGVDPITIGTSATSDICLTDRRASRVHCEVFVRSEQCFVRDLKSTNGTYLDGVKVVEASLTPGARLRIGRTDLLVECYEDVPPDPGEGPMQFGDMVGRSNAAKQTFAALRRVANTPLTCLLLGETGTGKELAARALHDHSACAGRPFLVVDCAAVGPQFIEDKLFGHERGAFTGATAGRPGVFEQARGGTVLLDEIGELPLELQPKLLGVLERREATRIGSHVPVSLDVRVVAATHRDLSEMVARGMFRQDLVYRLSEFTLRLPALRERPDDIGLIAERLLEREGLSPRRLTPDAVKYLESLPWRGNIRELRNVLRRAAVLAGSAAIDRDDLRRLDDESLETHSSLGDPRATCEYALPLQPSLPAPSVTHSLPVAAHSRAPDAASAGDPLFELGLEAATEAFRRAYVRELRRRFGNDLNRAAAHSGLHPKSVSRLFRNYGAS